MARWEKVVQRWSRDGGMVDGRCEKGLGFKRGERGGGEGMGEDMSIWFVVVVGG